MLRIFVSHSSDNNAEAIALYGWLSREGWEGEIFLDLHPTSGIAPGERWERKLYEAANDCEAVLFLISKAWLASGWCRKELGLAHRLNKRLFGVLIEDLPVSDIPNDLSGEWQLVRLASGRDHIMLDAVVPITQQDVRVPFSAEGLQRLKHGLVRAGLDPKYFAWPPANELNRPPYRGLKPFEADDAGIFFGRDAPIVEALDQLRGLREVPPPRLMVILGASGAGKSSFIRAGLLPRLKRDDRHFLPLPIIRPERAVISGENGLLHALQVALQDVEISITQANLLKAIYSGAATLRPLLLSLVEKATPPTLDQEPNAKPPTLIISIDQGEELFLTEGYEEAQVSLGLLRDLLSKDVPSIIVFFTIRSDAYERLQLAKELAGIGQRTLSLPPMPRGSYAELIKGPALRLEGTDRRLKIEDSLVNALLIDIDQGGKDALPLLAFTLERLYLEYGDRGQLRLADYEALGRAKGSIEAAIERAFKEADDDSTIPRDRTKRLELLRRGLIPWLAGVDTETGSPRRRVARISEIPKDTRSLIACLVSQRLLVTDFTNETREQTIEPAHESLLRQWGLLQGWLAEDASLLRVLEEVKRSSRDWVANNRGDAWLTHATHRLKTAERLRERPDLAASFGKADQDYLVACRRGEQRKRQKKALLSASFLGMICAVAGLTYGGFLNPSYLKVRLSTLPNMLWSEALPLEKESTLKPKDTFKECSICPQMLTVPAGDFLMGSSTSEEYRDSNESPLHKVTISRAFAVSKFDVNFDDWDACYELGGCKWKPDDQGWGRGIRPVVDVSWNDAQEYVEWLSKFTGKPYALLTEAEWEYAARAGANTAYPWGNEIGIGNANCNSCGSRWDDKQTAPTGSFSANAFGLYDMNGNVWKWVQDCYQTDYNNAPTDGSAWTAGDCNRRFVRGGAWLSRPHLLRSANRSFFTANTRSYSIGFRVGRSLR
jgi:formylglycine-generating enzyme required for sulfatase activity